MSLSDAKAKAICSLAFVFAVDYTAQLVRPSCLIFWRQCQSRITIRGFLQRPAIPPVKIIFKSINSEKKQLGSGRILQTRVAVWKNGEVSVQSLLVKCVDRLLSEKMTSTASNSHILSLSPSFPLFTGKFPEDRSLQIPVFNKCI